MTWLGSSGRSCRLNAKGKRNGPPCFALDTVDLSLKDFRSTQRVDTWD